MKGTRCKADAFYISHQGSESEYFLLLNWHARR
jgi:hypothetical protein